MTVTAVSESQSRVLGTKDSANVSRRSEERPLISANELLRFPLDEVLALAEGQYPIRARHVRYYEDRWFGPIERARGGRGVEVASAERVPAQMRPAALVSRLSDVSKVVRQIEQATSIFEQITSKAKGIDSLNRHETRKVE